MINAIMEAVKTALGAAFGEGYGISAKEAGQDMEAPYFSIQCMDSAAELFRGKRYYRRSEFCIRYFPLSQEDRNKECYSVLERLYAGLEYIDAGVLMRGTRMEGRVRDGVLEFSVHYDCYVHRVEEEEPGISEMISRTGVKEGD